ncbi:MAG: ABC transporter permease [Verrucomicrobia bacterium]|nr:ABC transporter permease [Verrucomicrobiota bacterium]
MSDFRLAFRQLARTPGLTLVIVLTLALGLGSLATVLCWLDRLVWRPLPGTTQQRDFVCLVSNYGGGAVSLPDLRDFDALSEVFVGTQASMPTTACLTIDRQPEWIPAQVVSANTFSLLGVSPLVGRTFLPDEDRKPGGNPVAVISERLWRRRFGGSPSVLGRVIDLNRHQFTIVGVVPAAFHGTIGGGTIDLWAPLSMIWEVRNQGHDFLTGRSARGWHNIARLQPGVSLEQARAAVAAHDARQALAHPDTNREVRHRVVPNSECPWGAQATMGPALRLLLVVCLGVQLIVIANVASLLLARATGRRKEVAVRLASGASPGRILRLFLAESVVLAAVGGLGGLLAASWATDAVRWFLPPELAARAQLDFSLEAPTVLAAAAFSLVTALVIGLVPAWQAVRLVPHEVLKESGRSALAGAATQRVRRALVLAEIALALVLLIGAGLCLKGLDRAREVDFGFAPEGVLLARLQIGMNGYTRETGPAFYQQAQQRLAALPGVEDVALASWLPLGLTGCKGWNVFVEGYTPRPGENPTHEYAIISPRYFATLRIPLLAGRDFGEQDTLSAPAVAIVNEAFARQFWPGLDPLGRRFRTGAKTWRTVVGVARTGKYNRLDEPPRPFFYLPFTQGVPDLDLDLCVRTKGSPSGMTAAVRQGLREIDPGVELRQTLPLTAHSSLVLFPHRVASRLLVLLSAVALILAALGVYAVMAYAVSQRTPEFGVRLALGATPADLLRQVLGQGMRLALAGTVAGLALALAVTHLLAGFLYGVSPFDPLTFASVPFLLILVAALACYLPARRATRVDPVEALRAE